MKTFEEVIQSFNLSSEEATHVDDLLDSSNSTVVEIHKIRCHNKITLVPSIPSKLDSDWGLGDQLLYICRRDEEIFWVEFACTKEQEVEQLEALWSR